MAKQIVEGKIDKIYTKDFGETDQYGNQYAVNVNIGGQWYGLGKKKKPEANVKVNGNWHTLAEGDVIEAVASQNGNFWNIKSSDVTVKEKGEGAGSNGNASNGAGGTGRSVAGSVPSRQNVGGDDRQDSIMRQSAMGYAATLVAAFIGNEERKKGSAYKAAETVVKIADEYFLPYAKSGKTGESVEEAELDRQETLNNQQRQAQDDPPEDFDDDIPF